MSAEIIAWIRLLAELGLEVYRAAAAGNTSKTVGEILAGRGDDLAYLAELDAAAREAFEAARP